MESLADTTHNKAFHTVAKIHVVELYRFLTAFIVQNGLDKGKPVQNGNAIFGKNFIHAVMHTDYSIIYDTCVKGKMRYVESLLSKTYLKLLMIK